MIITISGAPGSGKSSVGRELAARLRLKYISIGQLIREEAARRDEDITQLMADKRAFAGIQRIVEAKLESYAERDDLVIDGRDAFYHIASAFKVFLTVDPHVAAERIMHDARPTERYDSAKEALDAITSRQEQERALYKSLHGIDVYEPRHYDLVIDTSALSVDATTEQILQAVHQA